MWSESNPFLNGPFAPWRQEGFAPDLEVDGEVPRELRGSLNRISVSPLYKPMDPDRHHWFDGDGMLHQITFENGRAHYRNRYVDTAGLKLERRAGRALWGSLTNGGGVAPAEEAIQAGLFFKNPANTHATVLGDKLLVFAEVDVPHALDPISLDTYGLFDFNGEVSGAITAHFKFDADTGDLIFFGAQGPLIKYFESDSSGHILKRFEFNMGVPCFMHDFVTTPNYAIFCVNPTVLDPEGAARGEPWMVWKEELGNKLALMNRNTGEVQFLHLEGKAFAPTHWLNAYEEHGKIVIDGNMTKEMGIHSDKIDEPWEAKEWMAPSAPRRWVVDLQNNKVDVSTPFEANCDFPRINERFTGKKHRFGYYAGSLSEKFNDAVAFECLYKHDFETGKTERLVVDGLTAPSEAVFAPRAGGVDEEDGWLLSYWWDANEDVSEMVITDPRNFSGPPVARVKLNNRVPLGFHASWTPAPRAVGME